VKYPTQEILKAAIDFLNVTYDGSAIPVTTTFHPDDFYILISIPNIPQDEGTDDGAIYSVTLRVEVVSEFITDEERETVSNKITEQIFEQLSEEDSFNAYLSGFKVLLINFGSNDRETQQENTSSIIIKRTDFEMKVAEL
jgi:hypothetical protein